MDEVESGTIHSASGGGVSGSHDPAPAFQFLVAPSTASEINTARLRLIPLACWRVDEVRFAFDSSVVAPDIAVEMRHLRDLRIQHASGDALSGNEQFPPISIFGHADPVGNDDYNKALSGRRAAAIYGMLVRRTEIWEDLFNNSGVFAASAAGDIWGNRALELMRSATGLPAGGSRKALFRAYMDLVCTPRATDGTPLLDPAGKPVPPLQLEPAADFLAQGAHPRGKGDFQGCGEFNPQLIFSETENSAFEKAQDKSARNAANAPNRRVMALLFRPGSRIDPAKWPCPLAKEGVAGCIKRFFSDGETRRSQRLPLDRREFSKTKNTFACRFYHRLSDSSPCESQLGVGLLFMQCFDGDGVTLLAGRKYTIRGEASPAILFNGVLDKMGTLRHEFVPNGDYLLTVQGCSEDSRMAVLQMSETIPQIRMLENGRLAIRVQTPEGDPISDATVQVTGLGQRPTDEDGLAYFGTVPDGDFSFQVSKPGFAALEVKGEAASALVDAPPAAGSASGDAVVKQTRTEATVELTPRKKPVVPSVIQIDARQVGTRGLADSKKQLPLDGSSIALNSSQSAQTDLAANPPIVLVRGSRPILLKAITNPPGELVTWQVVPNQSPGPPPAISPKQTAADFEAQIETSATGSFSAQAQIGASLITWNFVLVGVDVSPSSPISTLDTGLQDFNISISGPDGKKGSGLLPGDNFDPTIQTGVSSGKFEFGKHAWSSQINITLKGGGPAGDLGCDQIVVQVLQNLVSEGVAGEYDTQIAFSDMPFPVRALDAPSGSPPGYDGPVVGFGVSPTTHQVIIQSPFLHTDGMFQIVTSNPTARVLRTGDSPGEAFENKLNGESLSRIRGLAEFRTAVVSFSKQSKNSIVAHADAVWRVDYTGDVSISSGVGEWRKTTARVINVQGWKPILSSSGVQGTDAGNALLEIFPPRAFDLQGKPKKVIPKP